MSDANPTGYLPGDPRYGLQGEASHGDSFIFRGPIRSADGADNIGTALLLELSDRAAAEKFWNNDPFAKNGGYQRDARIVRWVFGD